MENISSHDIRNYSEKRDKADKENDNGLRNIFNQIKYTNELLMIAFMTIIVFTILKYLFLGINYIFV
jgi:hypothetical protein